MTALLQTTIPTVDWCLFLNHREVDLEITLILVCLFSVESGKYPADLAYVTTRFYTIISFHDY